MKKITLFELLITDKHKSNLSKGGFIYKIGDGRNKPEKLLIRSINSNSFSFDNLFSFDVEEYYINDVPFRLLKEEVINAIYYDDLIVVFINKES